MAFETPKIGDSKWDLLRKAVNNQTEQGVFDVTTTSTLNIYVDPINGVNAIGKGTLTAPYQTINYAYSQISTVPATIAGQVQWCNEKIVFMLATGVYNENVVTGWKRARVAIVGYGAKIVGTLKHQILLADFPFGGQVGAGFYLVANNPAPWNLFSPFQTFELIGEGGGVDSAFSSMGLMVTGQVTMDYQDSVGAGALSWQGRFSLSNFLCRSVSLLAGMNLVSFNNNIGMTMQVDSSTIEGGSVGVLPRSGTLITVAGQTTSIALVAHNSQITSTIGAGVRLLQLDRCRLSSLDRTTGGVTDGFIIGSTSSSSSGIVNSVFIGATYKIGFSAVATVPSFTFDSNSMNRFLTGHVIDIGLSASVTYVLQDHSTYVKYPPTVPGNWLVAPTQVTAALDELASRVAGGAAKTLVDNALLLSASGNNRQLLDSVSAVSINWQSRGLVWTDGTTSVVDWAQLLLFDSLGKGSIDWGSRVLADVAENTSVDYANRGLYDVFNNHKLQWDTGITYDTAGIASLDWQGRMQYDAAGIESIRYNDRSLRDAASVVSVSWNSRILNDAAGINAIWWGSRLLTNAAGDTFLNWASGLIGDTAARPIGFWGNTPIVQPTTAVAAATFVANTSGIANDSATFDGYTIGQLVKALRNAGLLA